MNIEIKRNPSSSRCTIGRMYIDGVFECYTLEDVVRSKKIQNETAIPAGTYKVIINMSNRFKRLLPLLINVAGFEGVRIHAGNTDKDTEGCILVGTTLGAESLINSRLAFDKLFKKMQQASEIQLTIS